MTVNLNGYELTDEEAASMCSADREASWKAWKPRWSEVLERKDSACLSIVDDIHAKGVKNFIPHGYSIAQAVSARASRLASIGMIILDYDGETTKEGLLNLVKETYIMLIKASICMPEELFGSGGGLGGDAHDYTREHGYHMLSCSMLGEPDWYDCIIDYSTYAVDEDDPHGFLHDISADMFSLEQAEIRIAQYRRWNSTDTSEGRPMMELYENTPLGKANRRLSGKTRKLTDEAYLDVHTSAAKTIMLSMIECECVLTPDGKASEDSNITVLELKKLLDKVHQHLSWFFDYYHDERVKGGLPS